jgi:hypothetical protein
LSELPKTKNKYLLAAMADEKVFFFEQILKGVDNLKDVDDKIKLLDLILQKNNFLYQVLACHQTTSSYYLTSYFINTHSINHLIKIRTALIEIKNAKMEVSEHEMESKRLP